LLLYSKFLSHNTRITALASLVPQTLLNPYWSHPKNNSALLSSLNASIFSKIFEACGIRLIVRKSTHSWAAFFLTGIITDSRKSCGHSPLIYYICRCIFHTALVYLLIPKLSIIPMAFHLFLVLYQILTLILTGNATVQHQVKGCYFCLSVFCHIVQKH